MHYSKIARTAYFDENLSLEGYGEKIKQLIEESIVASNTIKLILPNVKVLASTKKSDEDTHQMVKSNSR